MNQENNKALPHQKHDVRPEEIIEHTQEPPSAMHCDIHTTAEKITDKKNYDSLNLTPKLETGSSACLYDWHFISFSCLICAVRNFVSSFGVRLSESLFFLSVIFSAVVWISQCMALG